MNVDHYDPLFSSEQYFFPYEALILVRICQCHTLYKALVKLENELKL